MLTLMLSGLRFSFTFFQCRYCGSLATGLVLEPEKTARLLEGGFQEFYNLKTTIKSHITLAGGPLHFEALQVNFLS